MNLMEISQSFCQAVKAFLRSLPDKVWEDVPRSSTQDTLFLELFRGHGS